MLREPHRRKSLSVDPGIEGVVLVSEQGGLASQPSVLSREKARHASRAGFYRTWIEQQYANATPSHPYILERGLIRMFVESGCIQLGSMSRLAASQLATSSEARDPEREREREHVPSSVTPEVDAEIAQLDRRIRKQRADLARDVETRKRLRWQLRAAPKAGSLT